MTLPADYRRPLWRGEPNGNGVGVIAVDPREAEHVLEHGATLDGHPCRVELVDSMTPDLDGRVWLRVTVTDPGYAPAADPAYAERWGYAWKDRRETGEPPVERTARGEAVGGGQADVRSNGKSEVPA